MLKPRLRMIESVSHRDTYRLTLGDRSDTFAVYQVDVERHGYPSALSRGWLMTFLRLMERKRMAHKAI